MAIKLAIGELARASHPGGRSLNEDSVAATRFPDDLSSHIKGFVAVADGMGGLDRGDVASQMVLDLFQQHILRFENHLDNEEAEDRFRKIVQTASRSLFEEEQGEAGSTLTAAVLFEDKIILSHVGDSRALLITPETCGWVTNNQSVNKALTNRLGKEEVQVETTTMPIENRMLLLLVTDGVTDVLSKENIVSLLRTAESPQAACNAVLKAAIRARTTDNCSVALFCRGEYEKIFPEVEADEVTGPQGISVDIQNSPTQNTLETPIAVAQLSYKLDPSRKKFAYVILVSLILLAFVTVWVTVKLFYPERLPHVTIFKSNNKQIQHEKTKQQPAKSSSVSNQNKNSKTSRAIAAAKEVKGSTERNKPASPPEKKNAPNPSPIKKETNQQSVRGSPQTIARTLQPPKQQENPVNSPSARTENKSEAAQPEAAQSYSHTAEKPLQPMIEPGTLVELDADVSRPKLKAHDCHWKDPDHIVTGKLSFEVLVTQTGTVGNIKFNSTNLLNDTLLNSASQLIKSWRFEPAQKKGSPVKVWLPCQIVFPSEGIQRNQGKHTSEGKCSCY